MCLSLLLSFASLAPLGARMFSESNCSCCRLHGKSCSKKRGADNPSGPAVTSNDCQPDCGSITLASGRANGLLKPSARAIAPPVRIGGGVPALHSAAIVHPVDNTLRQRPPPSILG